MRAVVVGGGLGGLATALRLNAAGWGVTASSANGRKPRPRPFASRLSVGEFFAAFTAGTFNDSKLAHSTMRYFESRDRAASKYCDGRGARASLRGMGELS